MPANKATKKKGTRRKTSKAPENKAAAGTGRARKGAKKSPADTAAKKKTTRTTAKKTAAAEKSGAERRVEERHEIPGVLEVEVELMGYRREGREFGIGPSPDREHRFQTLGTTKNLSTGGMLAQIRDNVTEGSHCLVRFLDAQGYVKPELRWGLVIRSVTSGSGYEVAVSFDVPLEVLDIEGLAGR